MLSAFWDYAITTWHHQLTVGDMLLWMLVLASLRLLGGFLKRRTHKAVLNSAFSASLETQAVRELLEGVLEAARRGGRT